MVVYRPFPTSNHNERAVSRQSERVVYRPFPTSNHNRCYRNISSPAVVYRPFPTSNHNGYIEIVPINELYIVRFLHQTTTLVWSLLITIRLYIVRFLHQTTTETQKEKRRSGCISSVSYIKPQPIISNKLYTNILLIFFIIKNGRVGFVSIAKILKKLQLNRFADDFFCDFA